MSRVFPAYPALLAVALAAAITACGSDDSNRRVITITQADDGCSPVAIDLAPGENVRLQVKNAGKKDREIEGIEGAKLEEVLVPSGKTRSVNFTAPVSLTGQKLKCYVPGGNTTLIELNVTAPAN